MTEAADWGQYNLPAIWEMIKDENACSGADRVLSWDTLSQQIRDQHERLLAAQEKLAEAWPPEKSASASAFQAQVTILATNMNETLISAEDTRVGLQGIVNAIATAQSTLAPLVQQRQTVSDDLTPRFIDHAEDEFDHQGQQAMRVAEAAIADHSAQINAPQLFRMRSGIGDEPRNLPPGTGSAPLGSHGDGFLTAVPIPVPVPHHPPQFETGSNTGNSSHRQQSGSTTIDPSGGPGLSGVLVPPSTSVSHSGGAVTGVALPGATVGEGGSNGAAAGAVFGGAAGLGIGMGTRSGNGLPPGSGVGDREQVPVRRGLPSGATIGAEPAQGGFGDPRGRFAAGPGVGGREQVPMRRGLPSGFTIGAEPSEGGFSNRGVSGRGPLAAESAGRGVPGRSEPGQGILGGPGAAGGRRGGGKDELGRGPADVEWGVRTGVAPVIEPNLKPVRHDPGPGVIGIDK